MVVVGMPSLCDLFLQYLWSHPCSQIFECLAINLVLYPVTSCNACFPCLLPEVSEEGMILLCLPIESPIRVHATLCVIVLPRRRSWFMPLLTSPWSSMPASQYVMHNLCLHLLHDFFFLWVSLLLTATLAWLLIWVVLMGNWTKYDCACSTSRGCSLGPLTFC